MSDQANDIIAILTETNVRTRRERAAFVAKLRDELKLTWNQIAKQINTSPQRARQLYTFHLFFQRSAHSPFVDLSTRSRHFLDAVACVYGMPPDWEQNQELIHHMAGILRGMTRNEAMKYRSFGQRSFEELDAYLRAKGGTGFLSIGEAEEPGVDSIDPKDFTAAASPQEAMQRLVEFMNQHGMQGEFKAWPKGTFRDEGSAYNQFTITLSSFLADAWDEHWNIVYEFDLLARSMGYSYERANRSTLYFFQETPRDDVVKTPVGPVRKADLNIQI